MFGAKRSVATLIENVALEGRTGISVNKLMKVHLNSKDTIFQECCWQNLLNEHRCINGITPIQFFQPAMRITIEEIKGMTLKHAIEEDIWVVACETLRYRALHLSNPMTLAEETTGFLILETVGKSRELGISTMDLSSRIRENMCPKVDTKKFDAELRTVHHYMDRLISQKLLLKKMLQITENYKCKRFNIVLLPRFDSQFNHEISVPNSILEEDSTWKQHAVEHLLKYLSEQDNHQCTFNDGMRAICAEKKKLEAIKNHIITESKKIGSNFPIEIFTAQRTDTKQKFWCLRLKNLENSQEDGPKECALVHEVGLLGQIYNGILAAGDKGITSPDLKNSLGMHSKWAYRLFNLIISQYPVRMEKTVIGRSSVYRLFATSSTAPTPVASNNSIALKKCNHDTLETSIDAIKDEIDTPSTTDTTGIRRHHISTRMKQEKVVSLYSLRSSIIELENYAQDGQNCHFNSGHRIDVRSIVRIVENDPELKLHDCEMPVKSSLFTSGTRNTRLVVHIDATEKDIKDFLNGYSRDTRIKSLNNKAFINPHVMIEPNHPPSSSSISYKLKPLLKEKHRIERDRERQSRLLGKCFGFLYRCRLFHVYLFEYFKSAEIHPALLDVSSISFPDRFFLLEPVFKSMPLSLYLQILGIGQLLQPDEIVQVQNGIKSDIMLAQLPLELHEKITAHQHRRLSKLIRALITLNLLQPYRLPNDILISLIQSADTKNGLNLEKLVHISMYDRILNGFFQWHHNARIHFNTNEIDLHTKATIRVNSTKFTYSFGHDIPLVHCFDSKESIELYWESLECFALERLSYSPSPDQVIKIPKLDSADRINLDSAKNWTPNSHGMRYYRQDKKPRIPGTDRIMKRRKTRKPQNFRPLRPRKYTFTPRGVRLDVPFTPEEDSLIMKYYFEQLEMIWRIPIPAEMQLKNETVAVRGPEVYRAQVSYVAITRAATLNRSVNRVRRRISELIEVASTKIRLHQLKKDFFEDAQFHEEMEIATNPRLSCLVLRVFMLLVTSDSIYNQMAAESLVGPWTRDEITTVWRYFWLKGWIVAPKPYHIRGFALTRRFQEIFKWSATMSYPLAMFIEAAEQAAFIESRDDNDDEENDDESDNTNNGFRCCGPLEHAAFVLDQGYYDLKHIPALQKASTSQGLKRRRDHRHLTSGVGILNHLDQSELDQWHATIKITEKEPRIPECAFSHRLLPDPPRKRSKITKIIPFDQLEDALSTFNECGMSMDQLINHFNTDKQIIKDTIDKYLSENRIVQVHGWDSFRYILPKFNHFWSVYPYSTSGGSIQLDISLGTSPHPWLKITTQPDGPWLVRFQRKLVALLIQYPGSTEAAAHEALEGVLPLQQLRVLLSDLVQEEVIYARIVKRNPKGFQLFQRTPILPEIYVPSDDPLLQLDRDIYIVHYFPTPDCIMKYGLVAQEINRI